MTFAWRTRLEAPKAPPVVTVQTGQTVLAPWMGVQQQATK